MVEKINKAPEESKESKKIWGEEDLDKFVKLISRLPASYPYKESEEWRYSSWEDEFKFKKEVKEKDGEIQKVELTINKLVNNKWIHKLTDLGGRRTTYKLIITREAWFYNFLLKTDDGFGHKDSRNITQLSYEIEHEILPNFEKRIDQLWEYKGNELESKKARMQELAYNDQNEADDMLWNLDQFYNA